MLFLRRLKFVANTHYILEIERAERATRVSQKNQTAKFVTNYRPFPVVAFKFGKQELEKARQLADNKPIEGEGTPEEVFEDALDESEKNKFDRARDRKNEDM